MTILSWFFDLLGFGGGIFAVVVGIVFWVSGRQIKGWWALLLVAVLGVPFVGMVVLKDSELTHLQAAFEKYKREQADRYAELESQRADALQTALDNETQVATLERALQETISHNAQEAHDAQVEYRQKISVAAAAAERRVRDEQRAAVARVLAAGDPGAADATADPAAQLAAARATVGVLSELYERCDSRAGTRAEFADAAHAAGARCEQDYDSARSAVNAVGKTESPQGVKP